MWTGHCKVFPSDESKPNTSGLVWQLGASLSYVVGSAGAVGSQPEPHKSKCLREVSKQETVIPCGKRGCSKEQMETNRKKTHVLQWSGSGGVRSLFSRGRNHWEGGGKAELVPAALVWRWHVPPLQGKVDVREISARRYSREDPVRTSTFLSYCNSHYFWAWSATCVCVSGRFESGIILYTLCLRV